MNAETRKALEVNGWKFGDAADFVGMTDEERDLMDIRIKLAISIRKRREKLQLSQKDLAIRLKTSQPRVAKIERAARDVSLDQIYSAYAVMGGRIVVKNLEVRPGKVIASAKGVKGIATTRKRKASKVADR